MGFEAQSGGRIGKHLYYPDAKAALSVCVRRSSYQDLVMFSIPKLFALLFFVPRVYPKSDL